MSCGLGLTIVCACMFVFSTTIAMCELFKNEVSSELCHVRAVCPPLEPTTRTVAKMNPSPLPRAMRPRGSVSLSHNNASHTTAQRRSYLPYGVLFLVIIGMYGVLVLKFLSKTHSSTAHDLTTNRLTSVGEHRESVDVATHMLMNNVRLDLDSLSAHSQQVLDSLRINPTTFDPNPATSGVGDPVKSVASALPIMRANIEVEKKIESSPQMPAPIQFLSKPMDSSDPPAVLIVGGTDGSGTRRVVQILTALGVTMVSEDQQTYDIHADLVGGWPAIVKPVVQAMHTLDYSLASMSQSTRSQTIEKASRLLKQVEIDSFKPTSYRLAVGGVLPKPKDITASAVKHGFKAPVSMTLLPIWASMLPHCKFIHVLRDGRDIAFSVNQGPVDKFYTDMYGNSKRDNAEMPLPVKAMRLWSDWNTQIHTWARRYAAELLSTTVRLRSSPSTDESKSFGYLAVHTEDVVSESRAIRFNAIHHLARFVGSSISNDAICCLAIENLEFMGSHDRSQVDRRHAEQQVSSRYGKWKSRTQGNPSLLTSLLQAGQEGLALFGYDPMRVLAGDDMISDDGYRCELTASDCHFETTSQTESILSQHHFKPEDFAKTGVCEITDGIDYKGDDIEAVPFIAQDPQACCRLCKEKSNCKFFTVDPIQNQCYLKFANSNVVNKPGLLSGRIIN